MSTLYGISSTIGADQLLQGGTITTNISISGAASGMVVTATPEVYPGTGIFWEAYVSGPNLVTLKVSTVLAGEINASRYFIAVDTGTGGGGGIEVVAQADFLAQQANLSFDLYTPTATGDFMLCDLLSVNSSVFSDNLKNYAVTYADENGPLNLGAGDPSTSGPFIVSAGGADGSYFVTDGNITWPSTIHAIAGTPLHVEVTFVFSDPAGAYDLHMTLLRLR